MISPEILRRYPFFGSLTPEQLKALAMIGEEENYGKGTIICEEGKPAIALFILIEGGASLYYKSEEEFRPNTRRDFLVGEVNPGEVFAISALIDPFMYTATVKAEQGCHVVKFNAGEVNRLIEKDPALSCKLIKQVAKAAMERLAYARVQLAAAWAK